MSEHLTLDIPARTIIKTVLMLLAVVFLYLLRDVLIVLLFATIIAFAMGPMVSWLERHRLPRTLAVLLLYVVFSVLLITLFSLVVPSLVKELNDLTQALPRFFESLPQGESPYYVDFLRELQYFLEAASKSLEVSSGSFFNILISIFGGLISLVAIIVISFYFCATKDGVAGFFRSVLPSSYEEYIVNFLKRSEQKIGKWFRGQLFIAFCVGLMVFLGLTLFGIKYALLLGIVAMIFELIPFVGPLIAATPAFLLAFSQSPILGFWALLFYVAVQQLESHILTPLILGKTTGLHPITIIISLLIGGKLAGILGILLAVPVAVIILEILEELAESRKLRADPGI